MLFFVSALLLAAQSVVAGASCKCYPSDSCWPSAVEWESFNKTIDGKLIKTVPPGSVCYPSEPNYSQAACESIISNWTAADFQSSDPASVSSAWTNNTCDPIYPNGTSIYGDTSAQDKGCSLGGLPQYVINVTNPSHIQSALSFAKTQNIRLNIKNTGHNGAGRQEYRSRQIWTHNLKDIQYHETFHVQGGPSNYSWKGSQQAVTIGAGVQGRDLYPVLEEKSAVAVTGTSPDVGVVGWATGGGHGFLTGEYGMGADNIIEASIVTPAGDIVTANEYLNSDLLWAIRGGGGGTFGVIVNMTLKAYPVPSTTMLGLSIIAKNGTSGKAWWKLIAKLHSGFSSVQEHGLTGYYTIGGPPSSSTLTLAGSLFLWNQSQNASENIASPLERILSAANNTVDFSITKLPTTSFFDLVKLYPSGGGSPSKQITASRLITKRAIADEQELFSQTLEEVGSQAFKPSDGTPNPSISGIMTISHDPVNNSLNPAWRDTTVHLITSQSWDDSLPAGDVMKIVNEMTYGKLNALRRLAPESGVYLNEANTFEPGWQWSFYGQNYERLRSIKDKYDPEELLWCNQCVGSESWIQGEDGRLCRSYQPI
ncbi:FAD-binding domain-containing protein [Annulohypoxylon stygium]|nr:FAD-binding domain-containing protein [Annulohypoxylon stygium]